MGNQPVQFPRLSLICRTRSRTLRRAENVRSGVRAGCYSASRWMSFVIEQSRRGEKAGRAVLLVRRGLGEGAQGGLPALPFTPPPLTHYKNPRFSLDASRLYANLLRVKRWHIGPGGDGTKAGFPIFRSRGFSGGTPSLHSFFHPHPPASPSLGCKLPRNRQGHGNSAAFCRKLRSAGVAADGNPPPTFLPPMRYCDGITTKTLARLLLQTQARGIGCRFVRVLRRVRCKEGKNSGVDHREIRENRTATVRVFRVFRGENASFLSLLAANSMEAPVQESLTTESGVVPGQTQSNPVKPSQTIFSTLTRHSRDQGGSIDISGMARARSWTSWPGGAPGVQEEFFTSWVGRRCCAAQESGQSSSSALPGWRRILSCARAPGAFDFEL